MTPQEIFDTAYNGIIKQGKPSVSKYYNSYLYYKKVMGHVVPTVN